MSQLFASGGENIGSFSFNISPSNEHPGLISFRMDWLNLLAVQGTLKSLLQHHSSKASILRLAFFIVKLSHPYMTTGKTIASTRQTFVGKVMSLIFNMLSRLVIPTPVFLPGESQGWGSLMGCHLWGCTESDTTEETQQQQQHTMQYYSAIKKNEMMSFAATWMDLEIITQSEVS